MFEKFHPLGPTSFTSRGINLSQHNYVLSESWFLLLSSTIFSTRIKITSIRNNCNTFFYIGLEKLLRQPRFQCMTGKLIPLQQLRLPRHIIFSILRADYGDMIDLSCSFRNNKFKLIPFIHLVCVNFVRTVY